MSYLVSVLLEEEANCLDLSLESIYIKALPAILIVSSLDHVLNQVLLAIEVVVEMTVKYVLVPLLHLEAIQHLEPFTGSRYDLFMIRMFFCRLRVEPCRCLASVARCYVTGIRIRS